MLQNGERGWTSLSPPRALSLTDPPHLIPLLRLGQPRPCRRPKHHDEFASPHASNSLPITAGTDLGFYSITSSQIRCASLITAPYRGLVAHDRRLRYVCCGSRAVVGAMSASVSSAAVSRPSGARLPRQVGAMNGHSPLSKALVPPPLNKNLRRRSQNDSVEPAERA